ncbi:hypothetical protein IID27_01885 [Patescibacteria group bacterium]|nr:hypothetical protein [Patescibacteria group bacterium]
MHSFGEAQDKSFRDNLKWYLVAGLSLINVFIWYALFAEAGRNTLTVAFLDVGQGDSILTSVTQYTL